MAFGYGSAHCRDHHRIEGDQLGLAARHLLLGGARQRLLHVLRIGQNPAARYESVDPRGTIEALRRQHREEPS